MSRTGVSRTLVALVALVAVASLLSCTADEVAQLDTVAPSADSIRVKFSCGAVDSIALTTPSGGSAWAVKRKPKDPISWVVSPNVTINSIVSATPADTLPLDTAGPQGGAPGTPFQSKVKENAPDKTFHYVINATCRPVGGDPGGANDVHLLIDPEMIIHPH
jgi:hypothetical protein